MRRFILTALIFSFLPTQFSAQPPARFDVASVKLNRGGDAVVSPTSSAPIDAASSWAAARENAATIRVLAGGRVESHGHTLRTLIAEAYGVYVLQKIEGKQDVLQRQFDISATAANPSLTLAEARAMMRTLVEERFQLRWRWQPREIDGYQLVPARDDGRPGPGLRVFTDDCAARAKNPSVPFASPDYEKTARCGWNGMNGEQLAVGVSMAHVADRLMITVEGPVSDRTGWPGLFSFDVFAETRLTDPSRTSSTLGAPTRPDAPPILEVFRRDLGLKLVKERVTINDFIVERVEPPLEN